MTEPMIGEIRAFPYTFEPSGWAFCNGQVLAIARNTALFSLLGTMYGGDGKTTFGLPNLQGSVPLHRGQGPGLSNYSQGQTGGSATVTLQTAEMPAHQHTVTASNSDAGASAPGGELFANTAGGVQLYAPPGTPARLADPALAPSGGSQPHNNMAPYLALNFCIALQGIYPTRP